MKCCALQASLRARPESERRSGSSGGSQLGRQAQRTPDGSRRSRRRAARRVAALPVRHAFGGALALAFCTDDPRGTADIDVNVFVGESVAEWILGALPLGVTWSPADIATIERDGQARLWWDGTPVDVFFGYAPFHWEAAERIREVPFRSATIPVLDCTDLAVFKAFFARSKDFADIEAMMRAGTLDVVRVEDTIARLLGAEGDQARRLRQAIEDAEEGTEPGRFPSS